MSDFRLRVFSSVAKNLSFTKASQELFISQPAITKHIQELETMYQTRLFERMGNKILLTDAGRLLLEHCEKILEDYGRLEYEMNLLRNEHTGELRFIFEWQRSQSSHHRRRIARQLGTHRPYIQIWRAENFSNNDSRRRPHYHRRYLERQYVEL